MFGCSMMSASESSRVICFRRRASFSTHSCGTPGGVSFSNAETSTAITNLAPIARAARIGTGAVDVFLVTHLHRCELARAGAGGAHRKPGVAMVEERELPVGGARSHHH